MSESIVGEASAWEPAARSQPSYQPLREGCFRLLRMIASSNENIDCQMEQFPVKESPEYVALSYVCGDGELTHTIAVNGSSLYVTQNLFAGMQAIFSFLERTDSQQTLVWIDAVCIDQVNLEEKAKQVLLMDHVYKGARFVLVWFGALHGDDVNSFRILEWWAYASEAKYSTDGTISKESSDYVGHLEQLLADVDIERANLVAFFEVTNIVDSLIAEQNSGEDIESLLTFRDSDVGKYLPSKDHEFWLHLLNFLNNSWFYRIWTIQEIRLAKRAFLLSEQSHTPWEFFYWFHRILCDWRCYETLYSFATIFQLGSGLKYGALVGVDRSSLLERPTRNTAEGQFQVLLMETHRHRAKERKDHIYGLLGLVDDNIRSHITVDYTTSTSTGAVFTQAVKAICELKQGAAYWPILMETYTDVHKEVDELPSWVPDFSSHTLISNKEQFGGHHILSSAVSTRYKHCAQIVFASGLSVATIRGYCIDRIGSAIKAQRQTNPRDVHNVTQRIQHLDMSEQDFSLLFGPEQLSWFQEMDVVFSYPHDDTGALPAWIGEFLLDDEAAFVSSFYHRLRDFIDSVRTHDIKAVSDAWANPAISLNARELTELAAAAIQIHIATSGKFLFRTVTQRIGVAPKRVAAGDIVCMIPGNGFRLHVLSADREKYITGNVSVDGFMKNGLLKALPLEENEWEDFYLR